MNAQKKKRRSKPPKEQAALDFLQDCLGPFGATLKKAMVLDGLLVFLFIVQMLFLAKVMATLVSSSLAGATQLASVELGVAAACLIVRPVLGFWRERMLSTVGWQMARQVKQQVLLGLGIFGPKKYKLGADGFLASVVTHEPEALHGYARFYVQKITAVVAPLMIAAAVASQSLTAAMVLLLTAPLAPIFMILIGAKTAKKSREQMDALADLGGRFLDWLRGSKTLTALLATDVAGFDIAQAAEHYKIRTMSVLKIAFLNSAVLEFLSALSIALVAVYLGFGLLGELPFYKGKALTSYETALFILLVVPEFYAPLKRLGADYHVKSQALAAAAVLAPLGGALPAGGQSAVLGDIVLCGVSVRDEGRLRLSPLSLHIKQGQKWIITGDSGSGKSTLLSVLLGFSDYDGTVSIGGVEVVCTDKASLQAKMGYLPQTHALLPLSIADNLRLAKPSASDDELEHVLQQVGLWSLVAALPDGLATSLSERGGGLSGGQAQRLAIAQLLLQEAAIWLLDEPTEHLDSATKHAIHTLLYELSADKTLIWVTHDTPVVWADGVCHLESYD